MNTRECRRYEAWLTALWLLAFSALVLIASGCERISCRQVRPDTEPTAVGSRILAGYETGEPEPAALPGKPVRTLPAVRPPTVTLPGPAERPWVGPPRIVFGQPAPVPDRTAPTPVPHPPVVPALPDADLAAGDALDVMVEGHPEFSGRWKVRDDGFLEVPDGGAFGPDLLPGTEFARSVGRVAELPPEDARQSIVRALRPFLVKPPSVKMTRLVRREG